MAAVAGKRTGGGTTGGTGTGHQRSHSTPTTATRNTARSSTIPSSSTTTTTPSTTSTSTTTSTTTSTATTTGATPSSTAQHFRTADDTITYSTSTSARDSARRRLTSKRHSSSNPPSSLEVSPLKPNSSVSGRQDSSTTVSPVKTPIAPSKRHSAASSAELPTRSRTAANPLRQPSTSSSSSSSAAVRHSRRSSDGTTKTTARKGLDFATPTVSSTNTTPATKTSALGSSRTTTSSSSSRPTSDPPASAATAATKSSAARNSLTSSSATTATKSQSQSQSHPQPPPTHPTTTTKPSHRRATSANSSRASSRAAASTSTSPIPPLPAASSSSRSPPPSAPPPPEATVTGIPPHIQAELDRNASIQISQPPRRVKAPARFSSNGIATADAPPPSLAYRQHHLAAPAPPPPSIPPPPLAPQPPPPRPSVEDEVENFKYPPPLDDDTVSVTSALVTIEVDDRYLEPPSPIMTSYESDQFARTNGGLLNNGLSMGKYNATVEDDEPTLKDIQRAAQEERSFTNSPSLSTSTVRTPGSQNADDPFLSLARSSTPRSQALLDAQARQERRRSRMMQYSVNSGRTSGLSQEYGTIASRTGKSTASTIVSDDSFGGVELSQDPAPYQTPGELTVDDQSLNHRSSFLRRQREAQSGHARSVSEMPPRTTITRANGTTMSEMPTAVPRPSTQSSSVLRSPISTLIENDRAQNAAQARLGINDDVQSTISSGTVWDELDELKMRIKRLELTGTLPPASSLSGVGSGISNSSGDRPRTGTTAATTVSSSPRHQHQQINDAAAAPNAAANAQSTAAPNNANGPPPTIHPVLHAALAKSKTVLPEHVMKALDALANDTLNLAQAVGSTGQSTMSINAALNSPEKQLVTDRQVRRKVDNVCRSLTELCVALADGRMPFGAEADTQVQTVPVQPPAQMQQPQMQIQQQQIMQQPLPPQLHPQVQTPVFPMRADDPIERSATAFDYRSPSAIGHRIDREATVTPNSAARAHARFEARRASLLGAPSPQFISRQEASPSPQPGANRLSHRNSMSLRDRQRGGMMEPEDELEVPQAPNYRSPSRASNMNTSQISPMRASYSGQGYESSPMQRTLTLREQRAQQQSQFNQDMGNNSLLATSTLPHRRTYSTATAVVTPPQNTGLGLGGQRRSYLDRERGIVNDPNIGTALTTGAGIGSASQPIDISRRRTEYLRAANGAEQDMAYSPPQSMSGSSISGRTRTASVSSRVGSVRTRTNLLGSNYAASGRGVDTGLGLGRDRILNTTRR
ncbi:hypothetical protein H072_6605 [Dactylellina haptotyla CBS 200.50]|uniref:Uncharacterized protein n=1 Tax=Dactylellina haptotyla (strain CBS 200.50) TaxID=1284197 RepID=S8A953_DACHA|nr:hypothetical protein H072_6605 [Dactylellina haptotyla CBS 200.50]